MVYNEYRLNNSLNFIDPPPETNEDESKEEKKQVISEGKHAKKRIIPIVEKRTYSNELEPHAFKFKYQVFSCKVSK